MDFTANQNKKQQLQEKEKQLAAVMDEYGKEPVCLAFSGGVDSSLLLKLACAAARRHGTKVWAVTFDTMLHPVCDLENARKVAKEMDADHVVLSVDELEQEELRNNPVNRCYLCKRRLFLRLQEFAGEKGCSLLLDGTNADDLEEYRPGLAALRELGVKLPLASCGLTKKEVKALGQGNTAFPPLPAPPPLHGHQASRRSQAGLRSAKWIEEGEEFLKRELFLRGKAWQRPPAGPRGHGQAGDRRRAVRRRAGEEREDSKAAERAGIYLYYPGSGGIPVGKHGCEGEGFYATNAYMTT